MKGQAEIVLVGVISLVVVGGFYLNLLMGREINIKEIAKETAIIEAVNKMESVKKGLPYCLYYSYLESLKREGYTSFSEVKDEDGFKTEISSVFNEYRDGVKEKTDIIIPSGKFNLTSDTEGLTISFTSTGFLTYESSSTELSFSIAENPNVTVRIINDNLVE